MTIEVIKRIHRPGSDPAILRSILKVDTRLVRRNRKGTPI
jgi:hypothetical protein